MNRTPNWQLALDVINQLHIPVFPCREFMLILIDILMHLTAARETHKVRPHIFTSYSKDTSGAAIWLFSSS